MAVWRSLEGHEDTKGRHIHYGDLGRIQKRSESARREFKFDSKQLNVFWDRAVRAWLDGWLRNTMPAELPEGMKPSPEKTFVDLSPVKRTEIHCDADGMYKWGGWKVSADTADEALEKLRACWTEHQQVRHGTRQKWKQRRLGELEHAKQDLLTRRSAVQELRHPQYSVVFKGTFFHQDGESRFEEEHTGVVFRSPPVDDRWRDVLKEVNNRLYMGLRGEHAKRQRAAKRAVKEARLSQQVPLEPGEMTVKGKSPTGQLIYTWKADDTDGIQANQVFEVLATPRAMRPASQGVSESAWKQKNHRETTP